MEKKLQVIFVTTGYPLENAPNRSIFVHRSIKVLEPFIQPKVIHLRAWRPGRRSIEHKTWEGIEVLTLFCPQGPSGSASHINTLLLMLFGRRFLRAELRDADLIHSTDIYPAGFIASRWARYAGKPYTSHVIGSDLNLFLAPLLKSIGISWLLCSRGIVCTSDFLRNRLRELAPEVSNAQVIYYGVDQDEFSPVGASQGPQSSMPPVRFLYLGGFHTWDPRQTKYYYIKGGHFLLEAWRQVETRIGASSLLISGPGIDVDKLEEWRSSLTQKDKTFYLKAVNPSDVPALLRACDVVVIPSLTEGLPNLANEAQACGRPVLATDAGGIPETVIHGETGRIVPRGDVSALVSGLEWFYSNRSEIPRLGQNGRDRMLKEFSWDTFAQKMMALFRAVT